MSEHHAAGYREAEPGPTGFTVARFLQAHERSEHVLEPIFRDAGTSIIDRDLERIREIADRDLRSLAVADRILHQVVEAAPERHRPRAQDELPVARGAELSGRMTLRQLLQQRRQVDQS